MILIILLLILLMPNAAQAQCCENYGVPPQLDCQQANRWINANPWERPYLARLWEIPQNIAEYYGAQYKLPVCGLSLSNGGFNGGDSLTNPYIRQSPNEIGTRWDVNFKQPEIFIPIPIEYTKPIPNITIEIKYSVPPSLDNAQAIRWGQSLPSSRPYLARIWDIPIEEAIKYGARY
jgi:hypothetical protein